MTAPGSPESARQALASVPDLDGARVLRRLAAGPTNLTWLVEHEGRQWVLRQDRPAAAELGLDRENERQVCVVAAAAGITPAYRVFDAAAGIYLRRFVPGRAWSAGDLRHTRSRERLAAVLRKLHALPPDGEAFDPGAAVRRYAEQLGSREASALEARALIALASIEGRAERSALCHNDLVAENMLETEDEGLMLIDWEYAGVGDPWFDLAVVIRHHGLDERLAQGFLEAYLQRVATVDEFDQLTRLCGFYADLLSLWNLRISVDAAR